MTRTPKPTRETRREAAVKPRKRRCVRIEAVDEAGKVVDGYVRDPSGWWRRITVGDPRDYLTTALWRAERILRESGRTGIRKVYEEAP